MPTTNVVAPSNIQNSYFPTGNFDFAYAFTRGSARWVCAYAFGNNPTADKTPAIFKSVDSGVSWSLIDNANAPVIATFDWRAFGFIVYDTYFNQVDTAGQTAITFMWAATPLVTVPNYIVDYSLNDFNFVSGTYGSPYGVVSIANVDTPLFSHRPDGSAIIVYTMGTAGAPSPGNVAGTYAQIYSLITSSWGPQIPIRVDGTDSIVRNLAVDSTGAAHVMFTDKYFQISAGGSVSVGASLPVTSTGNGNLSIVGNSLIMPAFSSGLFLLTGTPLSAPVWTALSITTFDPITAPHGIAGMAGTMWYSNQAGSYAIALEDEGTLDDVIVTTDLSASGPTLHWATADWQAVGRAVKSGSAWGSPTTVWIPTGEPGTPLSMFSLCARGTLGGGIGSRYRPIFSY